MIIWTGWGILAALIGIGVPMIFQSMFRESLGNNIASFLGYGLGGLQSGFWVKN